MFARPPSERESLSWLFFALASAVVFAATPLARAIEGFAVRHFGRDVFLVMVVGAIAAGAILAVHGVRQRGRLPAARGAWLLGTAAGYVGLSVALRANAEETIHLVEYGVLGVLAFRALSHRTRDAAVYPAAALLGGTVGLIDEVIQWMLPNRVWDLRDLGLNLLGASGVQLALAAGVAPPWIERRFRAAGLRRLSRIALLALLLLGACLLNTPERIAWYARRLPPLGFLLRTGNVMLEYGHLHEDPEIGRFRSRFALADLARLDAARGASAGAILARLGSDGAYASFLALYSPITDPFLHETRVHLFRRDEYLRRAEAHADDPRRVRSDVTTAFRENRILEKYFAVTLAHSGRALEPRRREFLATHQAESAAYTSRVSRGLVTRVDEGEIALGLALGLAGCVLFERACTRRAARS